MKSSSEGERYTGIKSFMSTESDLLYDVCFAWHQCNKELKQEIFPGISFFLACVANAQISLKMFR